MPASPRKWWSNACSWSGRSRTAARLGRKAFVERVWAWKAESGGAIVAQLKRLGASCDWSRERFTLDEGLSRAVAKVFVQLYREGLVYKDKRLVNWDPKFQTAISDLEVVQVETKGSFKWSREDGAPLDAAALAKVLAKNPNGHLYYFEYPVVDSEGEETGERLTVATTRPETMLGDTAVAVHPDDPRYQHLIGKRVRLPLVGRLIAIVADEYSDPEKGAGAVKITPAHDFNDFEVGKRHEAEGVRAINILDAQGQVTLKGNVDFFEGLESDNDHARLIAAVDGQDRFVARSRIVEMMALAGLLAKIEPHAHAVPHGDRSNVVIEPWLTDQWYADAKTLAEPAIAAVREGKTQFVPKTWEKTYFDWLENIQPWCISRQLWWGHQIPAWYAPWGAVFVEETEDAAYAAALADGVERGALAQAEADALAGDPARLAEMFTRDEDVLDTWFSSALWPFSTLGWPDETPELKRFYPTDALVTGFDIIFFWVARMMMMGLHFMEEVPFHDVYIHALVRDEKGAKMSKSKGNVIDPLDLINRFGADALRFTLAAMAAQGRDIKLSEARIEGYRNFATKLWNASRFAEMNGCLRVEGFDPSAVREPLNRWILGEAASAAAETAGAIEAYRFNDAANAAYRFVWSVFCDWHLELAKPVLQGAAADPAAKAETQATIAHVLDMIYADAASLHAVPHRGALGDHRRSRSEARGSSGARAMACPRLRSRRGGRSRNRLGGRPDRRGAFGEVGNGRGAIDPDAAHSRRSERAGGQKRARLERQHRASCPRRLDRNRRGAAAWRAAPGRARRDGGPAACRRRRPHGGEGASRSGDRQGEARNRQGRVQTGQRRLRRPGA